MRTATNACDGVPTGACVVDLFFVSAKIISNLCFVVGPRHSTVIEWPCKMLLLRFGLEISSVVLLFAAFHLPQNSRLRPESINCTNYLSQMQQSRALPDIANRRLVVNNTTAMVMIDN